jgi:hypothetical protein
MQFLEPTVRLPDNKQLQRTVTRRRGDAASAPFHYAFAPRVTPQRAAAELRRYAPNLTIEVLLMRVKRIVVAALGFATLSGCAGTRPQPQMFALGSDTLAANSCEISCPANSAYAEARGSVGCVSGATPVCQCTDRARPMASCEVLE